MSALFDLPPVQLLEAAMRCCDHFGDSPAARQQMCDDLANVPANQWPDLLDHFTQTYGGQA